MTAAVTISVPAFRAVDYGALYSAIASVERVRKSHKRGPFGERGDAQWTLAAWVEETDMPFEMAEDPVVCRELAIQRLRKMAFRLSERRIDPTPYLLALAWHLGLNGAILRGFVSQEGKSYAERVCALYRAN
jgi:hypothetical protein